MSQIASILNLNAFLLQCGDNDNERHDPCVRCTACHVASGTRDMVKLLYQKGPL